ncbi:unnamed protein product, partial [Mesorhabditis belari]|uniref:Uncharacterized protein n=1 Tax=Mesorhabditis belari TaxID=2138241 RepID=A0AAF3F934_9BILA
MNAKLLKEQTRSVVEVIPATSTLETYNNINNSKLSVFRSLSKTSTPETLSMAEALGKAEVHRKLETLLLKKENLIAEAHAVLDPKIEKTCLICRNMLVSKAELEAELAAEIQETTYADEDLVDSRSASLPINFPRSDSPEYDEISDTEIDRYVSKPLEEDAVREMDYKFRVLKSILEQIDDKNEKQRHFEEIYQEYATWCEARIDSVVMMYFVHKFHTECALYMREHHGIEVNVWRYENELIRRTEDPKWTDAQKLKRKVLQRRKSNPTKKKICARKVKDVFNELLAEELHNVLTCGSLSIAKISALIESSKRKRDCFSRTFDKYDKYVELSKLLDEVLVDNWIFFFYCLPNKGFGERDTLNEYERLKIFHDERSGQELIGFAH